MARVHPIKVISLPFPAFAGSGSVVWVSGGYTATHYVAPYASVSGAISDTDTTNGTAFASATSISSPCTLGEALLEATAGNIIECAPGVIVGINTNSRFDPAWRATNNGSLGNPIVLYAVNPAANNASSRTELRNNHPTADNAGGPSFGCNGEDYIIWDGFFVNENISSTHTDTGPAGLIACTGSELRRCVIQGDPTLQPVDNHTSIRIETSNAVAVRDCICYDNYSGSNRYNGSCIETYDSYDYIIENNELYDSHGGVFIKGTQQGQINHTVIIRNNHIHDTALGITLAYTAASWPTGTTGSYGSYVYQNIIDTVEDGIVTRGYAADSPQDFVIAQNLIINTANASDLARSMYIKAGDYGSAVWRNNIIVDTEYGYGAGEEASSTGLDIDDNMFHNFTDQFGQFNGTNYGTLAAWVAATPWDTNSADDDPLFTDEVGADYTLSGASPALAAGTDYLNLLGGGTGAAINYGPYILADQTDEIGVRSNPSYP